MTSLPTTKHFSFVTDTSSITNPDLMISARRLTYCRRQFIFAQRTKGKYSKEQQLRFEEGTAKHEAIQSPYKTIDEMGYLEYRRQLYKGTKISLKELKVLSTKEYMFGVIDLFEVQFIDGILNVWITEFKSGKRKHKNHFKQLTVYAMICSDIQPYLVFDVPYKRKEGNRQVMGWMYPDHTKIKSINIKGRVYLIDEILIQPFDDVVVNNEFTYNYSNMKKWVWNTRAEFRDLILQRTAEIETIKYDKYCTKDNKSEWCGWKEECGRYGYCPKSKQLHISQKKIADNKSDVLVKTNPKL